MRLTLDFLLKNFKLHLLVLVCPVLVQLLVIASLCSKIVYVILPLLRKTVLSFVVKFPLLKLRIQRTWPVWLSEGEHREPVKLCLSSRSSDPSLASGWGPAEEDTVSVMGARMAPERHPGNVTPGPLGDGKNACNGQRSAVWEQIHFCVGSQGACPRGFWIPARSGGRG